MRLYNKTGVRTKYIATIFTFERPLVQLVQKVAGQFVALVAHLVHAFDKVIGDLVQRCQIFACRRRLQHHVLHLCTESVPFLAMTEGRHDLKIGELIGAFARRLSVSVDDAR